MVPLEFTAGLAARSMALHLDWAAILIPIAFVAIAIMTVVFIVYTISGARAVLNSLADEKSARGLITFLITLGTVAVAIILALASIISAPAVLKDCFALGREVLSILIGVLGTVVGFYFDWRNAAKLEGITGIKGSRSKRGVKIHRMPWMDPTTLAVNRECISYIHA